MDCSPGRSSGPERSKCDSPIQNCDSPLPPVQERLATLRPSRELLEFYRQKVAQFDSEHVELLQMLEKYKATAEDQVHSIYCIATFSFLLLSLLEAILVRYLIEKDSTAEQDSTDEETDDKEGLMEILRGPDVSRNSEETKVHLLCLAVQELRVLRWSMRTQIAAGQGVVPPRFWTRLAKRINVVFFSLYCLAVIAMLVYLSLEWSS